QRDAVISPRAAASRSVAMMRSRISVAALRVNVIARMFAGSTPALSRLMYRSTSTRVFPVPADASRATLKRGSTARARPSRSRASMRDSTASGSSNGSLLVADIILPADRGIGTPGTDARIVRPGRKLAALDTRDDVEQPRARIGEHVVVFARLDHLDER